MKRYITILAILFFTAASAFSLVATNEYGDIQLNEKKGVFNFNKYQGQSYVSFFGAVANYGFNEIGGKLHLVLDFPEMQGFYFNGDFLISKRSVVGATSGDLGHWGGVAPLFGETYLGFKKKYFDIKVGFQNMVSSDAIYNHLMLDDYSGPLFGITFNGMISRFFDFQISYLMIRPHMGPWYNGSSPMTPPVGADDPKLYDAVYGKSLYFHKINIRPLPWIRIGIQESAFFLGENINPWYINPMFSYFMMNMIAGFIEKKEGTRYNMHTVDVKMGLDFNIGFNGWRLFGEFMIDDAAGGEYFKFTVPRQPDKLALTIGGEIRGYLFTKYLNLPPVAEYILKNFYFNAEYTITSKFVYSRDMHFYYEYVRDEHKAHYDITDPMSRETINRISRPGNFLGFMYGPNADCLDIAIGWRNDLENVKEDPAEYQVDRYLDSMVDKKRVKRLMKFQIHYRHYKLGDARNVSLPFGTNEHPVYDLYPTIDTNGDGNPGNDGGTQYRTAFFTYFTEFGNILDFDAYVDIVRFSRFTLGLETAFNFYWRTRDIIANQPFDAPQWKTELMFQFDIGVILSF